MCWLFGDFFHSLNEFFSKWIASEFFDELIVVDLFVASTRYRVGIDHEIFSLLFDFFSGDFLFFLLRNGMSFGLSVFHSINYDQQFFYNTESKHIMNLMKIIISTVLMEQISQVSKSILYKSLKTRRLTEFDQYKQ